jgi:raffinose/stachyose/melibiose transport system permease protein
MTAKQLKRILTAFSTQVILILALMLFILPIILVVLNSFKSLDSIFGKPFALPIGKNFDIRGYQVLFKNAHIFLYFSNSLIVTLGSMLLTLVFGSMASFALSEYKFKLNGPLTFFFAIGIMISIRLGSVGIIRIMKSIGLMNSLVSLILVYTASALPMTIFIVTQFMRLIPHELKDAARIDGANEYRVFWLIIPWVAPALATVTVFTMIPIWNDLWFPIMLTNGEKVRTVTYFVQQYFGLFQQDWQTILAGLTMSMVPILILYTIFSRQLIRGLLGGSFK